MIVGLVTHLSADQAQSEQAINAMSCRAGLDLGEVVNQRVPVVIESPRESVEHCTAWLQALTGVTHVDVVYVYFDEQAPSESEVVEAENVRT